MDQQLFEPGDAGESRSDSSNLPLAARMRPRDAGEVVGQSHLIQPGSALYEALSGLLTAICHAPSARGWAAALVDYETLLLRELGYGGNTRAQGDFAATLAAMDRLAEPLDHYLLADRRGDVMAARARLRELLGRMVE